MVQAFAALGDELGDHGILGGWLQKFQAGFAYRHHDDADLFGFDEFLGRDGHP